MALTIGVLNLQHSSHSPLSSTFYASNRNSSSAKKIEEDKKSSLLRLSSPHLFFLHSFCHSQRVESLKISLCFGLAISTADSQAETSQPAAVAAAALTLVHFEPKRDGTTNRTTNENIYNMEKAYFIYFFGIFNLRSRMLRVIQSVGYSIMLEVFLGSVECQKQICM